MRRAAFVLGLVALGCGCPELRHAVLSYERAMDLRERHPEWAQRSFVRAAADAQVALDSCDLSPQERLTMASVVIRARIETAEFAAAEEAVERHKAVFASLDAEERHPGDVAGIALLKAAHADNADRALVEYVRAEERVTGQKARAFLDLKKVEAMLAKATMHLSGAPAAGSHREAARRALQSAVAVCDAQSPGGPLEERFRKLRGEAAQRLEAIGK